MFTDQAVQDWPTDYVNNDEQMRFGQAGWLWRQAAEPGSEPWNRVMEALLERDFVLSPTFTAYLTSRDFMRMSRAAWHDEYTLPSLWDWYRPSRTNHGSYWFAWTTEDAVAWQDNNRPWMCFVTDYKHRGGTITVGSERVFITNLYRFGHIQELELLSGAIEINN